MRAMGFVPLLLFGLLVVLTLRQAREPLTGTTWLLLRSLFPSWRFFEDIDPVPELEFRVTEGEGFGPWQRALTPVARRGLFYNPRGNLGLLYRSLVEELAAELEQTTTGAAPLTD